MSDQIPNFIGNTRPLENPEIPGQPMSQEFIGQPPPVDNSTEDDALKSKRVSKERSEKIIKEAQARAKRCMEWEGQARQNARSDLRFVEADSYNNYQWPENLRLDREKDERPFLTINKTRQHCLQIINDAKQNKPAIKFKAVGGGATYEAAQVWEGLARHIEYQSNATTAYDTATEQVVKTGFGYWLITTDYEAEDSFDQVILIKRIKDQFSAFLDPDIQEADGSDARFGFLIVDEPKDVFEETYPHLKDEMGNLSLEFDGFWVTDKIVRVVQYYRMVEEPDELLSFVVNPQTGERQTAKASTLSKEIIYGLKQDTNTRTRKTTTRRIEWFRIAGNRVLEEKPWPGVEVPIIRVIGEETIIDGQLDRKGHVRALLDPQRMYNYWTSGAVENVALQSKTPYVGPSAAFEGFQNEWATANTQNHSYLPYNHMDDDGQPIPPPQRQQPVTMPEAYISGMTVSSNEMMMVSGQYQSQMGAQGNEVSGKAIGERQRQGDNATYHYIDNLAIAIRRTGRIILDLVPKIYDTKRVLRILNEDGTDMAIQIDPNQKEAHQPGPGVVQGDKKEQERQAKISNAIMHVLNPAVGKYEVHSDVGPAYSTRRQEAFQAYTQIITQAPTLTNLIGDILLKAGDFPMSDEAAERLKRMVPLQALGDAPPPEVLALQQQVTNLTESLTAAIQALGDKAAEMKVAQEKVQVDVYKAQTDRLEKLLEMMDPETLVAIIQQTVETTLASNGMIDAEKTSEAFLATPLVPPGADDILGQGNNNLASGLEGQLDETTNQGQSLDNPMGPTNDTGTLTQGGLGPNDAVAGMRQAKDGNYYIPDPNNPGKYMQVMGG